eukprot:SAG11_NODE_6556_length_1289_cov_1.764706_1_plen_121_part_00
MLGTCNTIALRTHSCLSPLWEDGSIPSTQEVYTIIKVVRTYYSYKAVAVAFLRIPLELRVLPSLGPGALVLTAGRPRLGLWLADGRGGAGTAPPFSWNFYNAAREHNSRIKSANLQFLAP